MAADIVEIHPDGSTDPVMDPGAAVYDSFNSLNGDILAYGANNDGLIIYIFGGEMMGGADYLLENSNGGLIGPLQIIVVDQYIAGPQRVTNAQATAKSKSWFEYTLTISWPGQVLVRGLSGRNYASGPPFAGLLIFKTTDQIPNMHVTLDRCAMHSGATEFNVQPTGSVNHLMTVVHASSAQSDGPISAQASTAGTGKASLIYKSRNVSHYGPGDSLFQAGATKGGAGNVLLDLDFVNHLFVDGINVGTSSIGVEIKQSYEGCLFITDQAQLPNDVMPGGNNILLPTGIDVQDIYLSGGHILTADGETFALKSGGLANNVGTAGPSGLPTVDLAGVAWGNHYNVGACRAPDFAIDYPRNRGQIYSPR